jgi:hypothetical protein
MGTYQKRKWKNQKVIDLLKSKHYMDIKLMLKKIHKTYLKGHKAQFKQQHQFKTFPKILNENMQALY